jgi:RNA polymerase sigma-70 factor (ECF subfamily)
VYKDRLDPSEKVMQRSVAVESSGSTEEDSIESQVMSLMDRYERPLFNYVSVYSGSDSIAAEATQHAYVAALEHILRGKTINGTWLYRVARKRAVDEMRRQAREDTDVADLDPPSAFSTGDRDGEVRQALSRLKPAERELLYLYDVDRLSSDEIASMLGVRPGTVRMRAVRARERFRQMFASSGVDR